MNKKKLLTLAMVLSMVAILVVGGTIAYFTDTDKETNTFTTGDVEIDLKENFVQDSLLMPGKDIQKQVFVKNVGSEPAYVRVHIAYPSMLDSGSEDQPQFAAYNNTLHWNFSAESAQEGEWSQMQSSTATGSNSAYPNWPGNGGEYNMYQATIDGILYNVYVMTYETALEPNKTTATNAIEKVYLDVSVTNEKMTEIKKALGKIKVLVYAEGGQKEGFDDAFVALNKQLGDPMAEGYVAPWNK